MIRSPHKFAYITIAIVSVAMMLIVANLPFKVKPFGDIVFHEESKNLALFLKGHVPAGEVAITRAPGPILFYAPVYLLAPLDASDNELWTYGVTLTTVLVTMAMLLIYRTSVAFFSRNVAVLAMLLFILFPIHCYYSLGIIGEVPAFFSLSVALYGWSVAWSDPVRKRGWILLIIGLLFLILNRPNAMLLFIAVAIVIVYSRFKLREFYNCYARKLAVSFTIIALLGIGALQLAKHITGDAKSDSQDNLLYYVAHQGRFQFREEPTDFRFWDNDFRADSKDYQSWGVSGDELSAIMDKTGRSYKDVYREFLVNDVFEHPFLFARQFFVKCFYGHVYIINSVDPEKFSLGPLQGRFGYIVLLTLINTINIMILTGLAIFIFTEKNQMRFWLFWGIILSLLVFHGLTYMEPRYLFPSKAALVMLSAAGLYKLQWIRRPVDRITYILYPVKVSK